MDIEWLILADAAQVSGNKLYLLGGGWDVLTVNQGFPARQHCAIAASFAIDWTETNQQHAWQVRIESEDGVEMARFEGQMEAGRPAGVLPGTRQRMQIAADLTLEFTAAATYVIVASVNGETKARTSFRVVAGAKDRA